MICKPCAQAADGKRQGPDLTYCPVCDRQIQQAWGDKLSYHKREVLVTETYTNGNVARYLDRERCPGSSQEAVLRPAWTGHDDCLDCPCRHLPSGSWNQRP